jgi:hypothetical protein
MNKKVSSQKVIKDIRRRIRTKYSSEEKIRIALDGIRAEVKNRRRIPSSQRIQRGYKELEF